MASSRCHSAPERNLRVAPIREIICLIETFSVKDRLKTGTNIHIIGRSPVKKDRIVYLSQKQNKLFSPKAVLRGLDIIELISPLHILFYLLRPIFPLFPLTGFPGHLYVFAFDVFESL